MNRTKKYLPLALSIFTIAGFTLESCSSSAKEKKDEMSPVTVVLAQPSSINEAGIVASGQLESNKIAVISTRVMGSIRSLNVKVGDRVRQGQLLANISDVDIIAQRRQAEAAIAEAKAATDMAAHDMERFKQLYRQQSASAKELENVTFQYKSASSKLETARQMRNQVNAMLSYTRITAPFTGVITKKFVDEGSMANPGMPILTLEQDGNLHAMVSVPESDINAIRKGSPAVITIKSLNTTLAGTVSEISTSSQFTGGQYSVKVSFHPSRPSLLKTGMYVNVLIPSKAKRERAAGNITVPQTAIINKDQLTGLYIADKGHALLRWVRLGKSIGDRVEVISGLSPEESYVISANGKLYNGCSITESR